MYNDRRVNTDFENFDPFRVEFDAYMSKSEQDKVFANGGESPTSIYDDANDDIDIQHAKNAIETTGWAVQELHAVSETIPAGWGAITVSNYTRLLKFLALKKAENALWVDTPTHVLKYIKSHNFVQGVKYEDSKIQFSLTEKSDARYAAPITVKVESSYIVSQAVQQGKQVPFRKDPVSGIYLIDANPFEGDVELTFDGPVESIDPLSVPNQAVNPKDCGTQWRTANLTNYESYPEPGSDECILYNGCKWAGQFAGLNGVQPEAWVMANNIAAVHSKDWAELNGKTIKLRQGELMIDVIVYDNCNDNDCNGCCSENLGGDGYLIDVEKYTKQRFGTGSGIVEWQVCN